MTLLSSSTCKTTLRILVLMLLSGVATPAWAQLEETVRQFDEGNKFYRDGRYEEAILQFEQAMAKGYVSGPLYYNLGNAHFRMDNLGQAIRYYEKAALLMPENEELTHNLEIARANVQDQFTQLPAPVWVTWWRGFVARTGGRLFLILGLLFYFCATGLIIYHIRYKNRNPWLRRGRTAAILLATLFLIGAFAASIEGEGNQRAVIVAPSVDLFDAPDETTSPSMTVHEGVLVDVEASQEPWVHIRLPNGTTGWVAAAAIADV